MVRLAAIGLRALSLGSHPDVVALRPAALWEPYYTQSGEQVLTVGGRKVAL